MSEAFQHVNRKGQVYYLQARPDKTGEPRYSFARKVTGTPVRHLPAEYEVRELPESGQVVIRRGRPSAIHAQEKELLERVIRQRTEGLQFIVDLEDRSLIVYTSDIDADVRLGMLRSIAPVDMTISTERKSWMLANTRYAKMLRFTLVDAETRRFSVERWCFLGSIDDWHFLESGAPLDVLAEKYAGHLGQDSFYELM